MRRWSIVLAVVLAGAGVARGSETQSSVIQARYSVAWQGYAAITTCVHDADSYQLGALLFLCDRHTYEYPYYYGIVALRRSGSLAELCLGDARDLLAKCIRGSLAGRW